MTWRQVVKLAKKEYGLKKLVWENENRSGASDYWNGTVKLNRKLSNFDEKLFVLFHELGHIHCYNKGIWTSIHHGKSFLTFEEKQKAIRTGWKVEKWVDAWTHKEIKKHFPRYKPKYESYGTKKLKKEFLIKLKKRVFANNYIISR